MSHGIEKPRPGQRLFPGKVLITGAATVALEAAGVEGVWLLSRHIHGDWGDIPPEDVLQNELALLLGLRVQSRYRLAEATAIWITTEANRATTTIILVEGAWEASGSG